MNKIRSFGEMVNGYDIPVFNEREVRASAGIMFVVAFFGLTNAVYTQSLTMMKFVVTIFLFDFFVRLFVNPKFSPTMIIGRWVVSNQEPEYVGARQKRFAWGLGVLMALPMFFVIHADIRGPITLSVCMICLTLMFLETSFGICIGCKLYNVFHKEKATLCPGGTCQLKFKEDIQIVSKTQKIMVFTFLTVLAGVGIIVFNGL